MRYLGTLWDGAKDLLIRLLEALHGFTGSYGIAIILLTILVRLLLYPLSQKQMTSMSAMQKIQPRIKVLNEKFGNDKKKLNEEMMRLYRENHVNPAAGCLPLLIQIPIMILLYRVLLDYNEVNAVSVPFLGIDLSSNLLTSLGTALDVLPPDGSPVGFTAVLSGIASNPGGLANVGLYLSSLLIIIAITFLTWFQQKLSGSGNNPQMATMNIVMPFFMAFICISLPGGILVYWFTSTLIGVLQQWIIMRKTKVEMAEKPVLYKNKPVQGQENERVTIAPRSDKDDDDEYEYYDEDDEEYEDDDEYEYVYEDEDPKDKGKGVK